MFGTLVEEKKQQQRGGAFSFVTLVAPNLENLDGLLLKKIIVRRKKYQRR